MKRIAAIAVIGGLLVAGSTWASQVTNVEISYQDGFTVARIDIQGPVRFTHQTEVPKDGRPDRVIVDLLSATHELGAKEFLELPQCTIVGIRSSQYAVSPEKIARVVFDLRTTPVYRIESDDKSVTVYFKENEPKSFAAWSTSSVVGNEETAQPAVLALQPAEEPVPEVKPKNVETRNEAIEQDRIESLSDRIQPSWQPTTADENPWVMNTVKNRSFNARIYSDESDETPTTRNIPQPPPKVGFTEVVPVPPEVVEQPKPILAVSIPDPVENPEAVNDKEEVAPSPVTPAEEEIAQIEPATIPTEAAPSAELRMEWAPPMALPGDALIEPAASLPTQAVSTPIKSAPAPVATEPVNLEPVVQVAENPEPAAFPETAKAEQIDTAVVSPTDFEPAVEPEEIDLAEGASVPAAPEPGAARATARFRRDVQSDKIRGTMVAEFPGRLVIKYEQLEQRDPFDPLIDDARTFNAPVENRIPNVEGLKLVGIIDSNGGPNQALFEDKTGFSYILKTGDKVRNGYVLRVEPEQVYFQIFEYGWSRTVALTME
ncbi:MAG: hypothetical protein NTW07_05015 [candidate division Zixibacteria bacterium]|nr:hypothetical protein [candidate division Zixibacteria bacterium]